MTTPQPTRSTNRAVSLALGRDDHRPSRRHDPVQATRHYVPRQPLYEADEVDVGGGKRQGQQLARLVRQEFHAVHDVQPLRQPDDLPVSGAEADDDDPQAVQVAQEGRRPDRTSRFCA